MCNHVCFPSDFADRFEAVFDAVAFPTEVGLLSNGERWRLLVEILLGHPPIAGFQRPRDFPLDRRFDTSIELASLLRMDVPTRFGMRNEVYCLYDWLVAFSLLANHHVECLPRAAREACYVDSMLAMVEHIQNCTEHPNRDWLVGFVLRLLRCDPFEVEGAAAGRLRPQANLAKVVAIIARLGVGQSTYQALINRNPSMAKSIDKLRLIQLKVIRVKTAGITEFLEPCTRHYFARGASTWCIQSLAWLRDTLLARKHQLGDAPILLIDTNTQFAMVASTQTTSEMVLDTVNAFFERVNHPIGELFIQRFPRLEPFVAKAVERGVSLTSAFPRFRIEVLTTNALDLATDASIFEPDHVDQRPYYEPPVAAWERSGELFSELNQCSGRRGHQAIDDRLPPWFRPTNQVDGNPESLGWSATVFSLVSKDYRQRMQNQILRLANLRTIQPPQFRHQVLAAIDHQNDRLCLVKIDGDGVGKRFVEIPTIRRPGLSLSLTEDFQRRLIAAIKRIHVASRKSLAIDIVYFGGDDFAAYLPYDLLEPFLQSFNGVPMDAELRITYSITALAFSEHEDRVSQGRLSNISIAKIDSCLRLAKDRRTYATMELAAIAAEEALSADGLQIVETKLFPRAEHAIAHGFSLWVQNAS